MSPFHVQPSYVNAPLIYRSKSYLEKFEFAAAADEEDDEDETGPAGVLLRNFLGAVLDSLWWPIPLLLLLLRLLWRWCSIGVTERGCPADSWCAAGISLACKRETKEE